MQNDAGNDAGNETGTGWLEVRDVARVLGITPRAVRFRIQSGTLRGSKIDGRWYIAVGSDFSGESAPEIPVGKGGKGRAAGNTSGDRGHVAARDDRADRMLEAVLERWIMPLVERVGAVERENGRLRAERDGLTREVELLRVRIAEQDTTSAGDSAERSWGWAGKLRRLVGKK